MTFQIKNFHKLKQILIELCIKRYIVIIQNNIEELLVIIWHIKEACLVLIRFQWSKEQL